MSRPIIVTDIEGTTSSLSFVKEVLFPYAAQHLADYVHAHLQTIEVKEQLAATSEISGISKTDSAALIRQLLDWIEEDKKATPLKALQGMIWESGYETGAYKAHVYADAQRHLTRWFEQGLDLYVYSSGSVHAQKLFFQYSDHGDLRSLFSDYFDTTTGVKSEPSSYRAIAEQIGRPPNNMLFLSDIEAELDAASVAGMHTVRLVREQDYGIGPDAVASSHDCVSSFDEVVLP